jgi:hypothetical protein
MHRKIELLPPEAITCGCCRNSISFGAHWCPACGAGIKYHRTTPMQIIGMVFTFLVAPIAIVALYIPELGASIGWPTVITVSVALGAVLAQWAFKGLWPRRHQVRVKLVPAVLALVFLSNLSPTGWPSSS